ncbi:ABC transporter permease [Desulfosporosinus youngiae]|uniref:ABC-type dipeptide/oligopeptide/nickel transport system, permease component n=1 Tax=Desulfosporosinus youngiae DSM 17734 TaxID=768710 RepID=H5Y537_9FIRM|nr:ABC transporter permease [Desulfosporosinus youngiae]EHQ90141.1 ABC-type dipeptide/oligopeptide/nickel transport system, permease component [Desulfosporosinus youngiae DSM 17734]
MSRNSLIYILTTLLRMMTLLVAISIVTFMLVMSSPIDPIDAYVGSESNISQEQRDNVAEYWGLNKAPAERYLIWAGNLLEGDMGTSITYRLPVSQVIAERFKASCILMGVAWVLSGLLGFIMGILAGVNKGRKLDRVLKTFCLTLSSAPTFWVGLLILMVFAVNLKWFPIGLAAPIGKLASDVTIWERIHHLILPAFTLSIIGVSNIALHTRQKIIDVLESDYVLFAKARGESTFSIVKRHGLRNIMLPAITLQFASFSELFGGSVLAEQVFSYPGLGNAVTQAGLKGDVPLFLGIALWSALFVFVGNFLANIIYGIVDPQIREGNAHG